VLVTGHTGFKVAWLSLWLRGLGAKVTGYALAPSSTPNLWDIVGGDTASIIGDVRDAARVCESLRDADPQIVIHMAAQALVRESYRDPLGTYATNVLGTGGGPPIASARAGNVIGGGDWSADRLVPDCVRALQTGEPVRLRFPDAVRPWQHVLEPLGGYLALAEALVTAPETAPRAVNFGPDPASFCRVHEVVDAFSARFAGKPGWERDTAVHPLEAHELTLSSGLAETESLAWTAQWYRSYAAGEDMLKFSEAQIAQYQLLRDRSR